MSLEAALRGRSVSPVSSGRSTPVPRAARRVEEDGVYKSDKTFRRYAATVERALASWEISPEEWADYIAFLGRLLKAIQSHPKDVTVLPHSVDVASKLAQCMNPALPSGVHQKALELYAYIFSTFGHAYVRNHLDVFFPGLSAVLSFASLSVRPAFYDLLEQHIITLNDLDLRTLLRALILSLLPALEDETSEDFERALRILEALENKFSQAGEGSPTGNQAGFFWQCLFLAVITSPPRRQGALNFLIHKLPTFADQANSAQSTGTNQIASRLSLEAEAVISPEPGLLVRAFVCGLSDAQTLNQRGFLDLLVTHLPLCSPLLQSRIRPDDLDRLITAAMRVLLRREMSLNRRLWSWFLGPEPKVEGPGSQPSSPTTHIPRSQKTNAEPQLGYFSIYGKESLERCVLAMFMRHASSIAERALPFRLCLSLMDRWEIGGSIVPQMFLTAVETAYDYSLKASPVEVSELVRSASLFFDSIEASVIWSNLLSLVDAAFQNSSHDISRLHLLKWIVQHFNIVDEEMVNIHVPCCIMFILACLEQTEGSGQGQHLRVFALEITAILLETVPERAFTTTSNARLVNGPVIDDETNREVMREALARQYGIKPHAKDDLAEISPRRMTETLYAGFSSLTLQALRQNRDVEFTHAALLLLTLHTKAPNRRLFRAIDFPNSLITAIKQKMGDNPVVAFPTISTLVNVVSTLKATEATQDVFSESQLAHLESVLTPQIWLYLSPNLAKYHVEATKTLWQMHDFTGSSHHLEASLTALLRPSYATPQQLHRRSAEAASRFVVLWSHSISAHHASAKQGQPGSFRRASTMPVIDMKQSSARHMVLSEPLMLVIDLLCEPYSTAHGVVKNWLHKAPTLEQVFRIHFDMLDDLHALQETMKVPDEAAIKRHQASTSRSLSYVMNHFLAILKHGNDWVWKCLGDIYLQDQQTMDSESGLLRIIKHCSRIVCEDRHASRALERTATEVVDRALSRPDITSLSGLQLDSRLIDRLLALLTQTDDDSASQESLLDLIKKALKLRLAAEPADASVDQRRTSVSSKRPSAASLRPSPNASAISLVPTPPPQLLLLLRTGFSATSARSHLDKWLEFMSDVLPVYSNAIFSGLIPLVECICQELNRTHSEMVVASQEVAVTSMNAPEAAIMALLEALEIVLARAHQYLDEDQQAEPELRPTTHSRGLLGNVTSSVFKSETIPSRTAQVNSRLTVILTFQDAIRTSLKLWIWGSHSSDVEDFDKTSAATTSYNALRVRNRTRHLLEQIFAVEPLESLEVVMSNWCHETRSQRAGAFLNLLHVLQGTRPKNAIPAILDALCSRANPSALPADRQSTQSTELTALDVALFLSAYLKSTEDDAMDEVWPDCMVFLRDVLSNPLPYRQVLPALLSTVLLLAQKLENTNFGEQRRMRRELADCFNRLLAATFTTMPAGYVQGVHGSDERSSRGDKPTASTDRTSTSLVSALVDVTANIEVILETTDRATSAVNSISSNLIGPMLRARSFPNNISPEALRLLLQLSKKAPLAKIWKKELLEAFNDPRILTSTTETMEAHWFPVLHQWCLHDKERMLEVLSRLTPPSSAGIMFGVGANTARLEADRRTQLNLRRVSLLMMASPEDSFAMHLRTINEKLAELFDASLSSSPSAAIKAELFMLCRAIVMSTSSVQLAPMWPIINENLHAALASLLPNATQGGAYPNLALLQACKLLDLLIVLSPDEFQLHEWLYVTDTIDAVYQPAEWDPSALSDQIAIAMSAESVHESSNLVPTTPIASAQPGRKQPLFDSHSMASRDDFKAMAREDFALVVLQPFLSQLSMYAYEAVYGMDFPDVDVCRRNLLEDLLDLATVVE